MEKINETISGIKKPDMECELQAQKRLDNLTKPQGSLGKLEWVVRKICGIKNTIEPSIKKKVIFTMAGDHGVAEEGVSAYPQDVTAQMVYNFINGGAAINALARHAGADVVVVDMGVKEKIQIGKNKTRLFSETIAVITEFIDKKINYGTKNFTQGPAMTRDEAVLAIEAGIDVFNKCKIRGIDILGVGDMGIANTTASAAIAVCITGEKAEIITGRGTGINDEQMGKKINAIKKAIEVNKPDNADAIDILSKVGGFEIGGIVGAILASASSNVPVVLDGFIASSAALIACKLAPEAKHYLISSHKSKESGHRFVLDYLKLDPILDLDLRLGEGTGSALAFGIIDAAFKIFNEMATFDGAGVSKKSQAVIHTK